MKKTLLILSIFALGFGNAIPTVSASSLIPTAEASSDSDIITLADLQGSINYLFPSYSYLTGLKYHSKWEELDRRSMTETSGIEVYYEAAFDAVPDHADELPTINAYILPTSSQEAAEQQFETWSNSSNFSAGYWTKYAEGNDYFSYYAMPSYDSDVVKSRVLEEGSLHLVAYYDNVLIVVNFYRNGGDYLRSNVTSYLEYIENYEETLSILGELEVYTEEALKFYLGSSFSVEGPSDYGYYPNSASYSIALSSSSIARNGTLSFKIYIDDASETGTILDMSGIDSPVTGALSVGINENAVIEFNFYDPGTSSNCQDESGWHHLYTTDSLVLYEWQTIRISYGSEAAGDPGGGLGLWLNGELQDECNVYTSRAKQTVYLGDYPNDSIKESFVGYIKDITTTFSVDESGNLLDNLGENMIFDDVSELHPYADAIAYLKGEGIIEGYSDGTYRPEESINRVEILKMLLLGFGYSVPEDYFMPDFSDVKEASWYLPYLNYALSLDIVKGHEDGTYKPSDAINRVEFLKILAGAYGINLTDYPITELYPDTSIDVWYVAYVQFSKDNNLMDVDSNGNFNPASEVNRGEVAETIYRLIVSP